MAYTVQCPSCSTEFPVDPAKVPEDGVNARCSSCAEVFFVGQPGAPEQPSGGVAEAESPVEIPQEEATSFETPAADEAGVGEDLGFGPSAEDDAAADQDLDFEMSAEEEGDAVPGFEEPAEEEAVGVDEGVGGEGDEPGFAESPDAAPPEFSSEPAAQGDVEISDDDFVFEQETLYSGEEDAPAAEAEVELEGGDGGLSVEEAPAGEPVGEDAETPEGQAPAGLAGTGGAPASSGPVQFGQRSPEDKAQRLARVLVSDMILYNPQRHTRAMENGTLAEEFEDEIKKSWEEYVDQVGEELAESTSHFTDALNEILAKGEEIF